MEVEKCKRERSKNFLEEEKEYLLQLIMEKKSVIECKKTDAILSKQKKYVWTTITAKFNASAKTGSRTTAQLKLLYDNVKRTTKKRISDEKVERYKTGGGKTNVTPLTGSENIVSELLGPSITPLINRFDSNGTRGLRDVRINVPSAVVRGDDATLHCYYDLEGEQLYAVKWYWYRTEFYRFTPNEKPPIKQFPTQTGLTVREIYSNDTSVVLEHVPRSVSGRYSCEVSADAPSFYTLVQNANLQVVDLPEKDPYISVNRKRYHHGDILKATCTSEHSNPAVNLTWYVNGLPAEAKHVNNSREMSADGQYYTAHSVLRMKITKQSFEGHRLKIRCVARMYDIYYKSHEKSVELERRRHHHFSVTTTDPPVQWELIEPANPEVRFVYNSSAGSTPFSIPTVAIVCTAVSLLLLR